MYIHAYEYIPPTEHFPFASCASTSHQLDDRSQQSNQWHKRPRAKGGRHTIAPEPERIQDSELRTQIRIRIRAKMAGGMQLARCIYQFS